MLQNGVSPGQLIPGSGSPVMRHDSHNMNHVGSNALVLGAVIQMTPVLHSPHQAHLSGEQVLELYLNAIRGEPIPEKAPGKCQCEHEVDYKIPGTGCGCSAMGSPMTPEIHAMAASGHALNWDTHFFPDKPGCFWPISDPDALLAHFGHGAGAGGSGQADEPEPDEFPPWEFPLSEPPEPPPPLPPWVSPPPPQEKDCCCCALTLKEVDHSATGALKGAGFGDPKKIVKEMPGKDMKPHDLAASFFAVAGTYENKLEYVEPGRCRLEWWEWTDNAAGNAAMKALGLDSGTWNNFTKKSAEVAKKEVKKGDKEAETNQAIAEAISKAQTCAGPCPGPGSIKVEDNPGMTSDLGDRTLYIAVRLRHGGVCKPPCPAEPPTVWFTQIIDFDGNRVKSFTFKSDAPENIKKGLPK